MNKNIESFCSETVNELIGVSAIGTEQFEDTIKQTIVNELKVKKEDIAFIATLGLISHPKLGYANVDLGEYRDGQHYMEIKITGEENKEIPVISICFSVEDNHYEIEDLVCVKDFK